MKFTPTLILLIAALMSMLSCSPDHSSEQAAEDTATASTSKELAENPAAPGFNTEASDPQAIQIADEVMEAAGGRKNWDNTRHLAWNFLGVRNLVWDKMGNRVRIETPSKEMIALLDMNTMEGSIQVAGEEITDADSLNKYLDQTYVQWINDSYWLVMPFKLKDTGVTLTYIGEDTTLSGERADVLGLTFEDVGKTPQNKYAVYVDKESKMVSQWDFFVDASDENPRFSTPWQDYQVYGSIKLSSDRGQLGDRVMQLTPIYIKDSLPELAYTTFNEWKWEDL